MFKSQVGGVPDGCFPVRFNLPPVEPVIDQAGTKINPVFQGGNPLKFSYKLIVIQHVLMGISPGYFTLIGIGKAVKGGGAGKLWR